MNYRRAVFEKYLPFAPNLMVSRGSPGRGVQLTLLITGICDLGKSSARGPKEDQFQEVRRGGVGRDPEEGESWVHQLKLG